ncbi:Rv3654c family TadE-like protein [Streptomyces sp. NPDC056468]|uniref:Rv3654c family TadE-like protein n=1 Tax=unclassified Streptomyces TaxID=2593676 RepID=UPI00367F557C
MARRRAVALRADRGSATVWSVGAIAVLCVVFGVVLALGQAVMTRHRAAGGADLAALAAADHWAEGGTAACARAERVAGAQGVRLVQCVLVGEVSDVTAASGRGPFAAEVRARAGPAGPAEPTQASLLPGSQPFGPEGTDRLTGSPQVPLEGTDRPIEGTDRPTPPP